MEWWKKVLGTEVVVDRVKEDSMYKTVYGVAYNDTIEGNTEVEHFHHTIVINMNTLLKVWNVTENDLQFYDIGEDLEMGDILTFSRNNLEYKWKITEIMQLTDVGGIVRQYTITPLSSTYATETGGEYYYDDEE